MCVCVSLCFCSCVCVCERERECVCVYVCVFVENVDSHVCNVLPCPSGSGGVENAMNELPVHILDNEDCGSMWLRVGIHVLDDQLCVGYGDTGACYVSHFPRMDWWIDRWIAGWVD